MRVGDVLRAAFERLMPWFDAETEARRDRRSRRIHRFSIAARIKGEKELQSYRRVSVHR